jgi:hypothetical protein
MEKITENKFLQTDYTKDWKHRAQGLTGLVLSGLFYYGGIKYNMPLVTIGATLFAIDGLGDTITGYHNYCGQKAIEGIKYITNKIRK